MYITFSMCAAISLSKRALSVIGKNKKVQFIVNESIQLIKL